MIFFWFHKVKWLQYTGEVGKCTSYWCEIFSGFNSPKIIKIGYFWESYFKSKKVDVFGTQCFVLGPKLLDNVSQPSFNGSPWNLHTSLVRGQSWKHFRIFCPAPKKLAWGNPQWNLPQIIEDWSTTTFTRLPSCGQENALENGQQDGIG